jgi:sulfoxide reductase heme-binding subunit YedZ
MRLSERAVTALKVFLFIAALLPLAYLVAGAFLFPDWLGANPAEAITRSNGDWTLRLILLALTVTPLRRLTGWTWLLRLRRMLGLFAFFYVLLHVLSYVSFDHVFDVGEILKDIVKRPFITVGFICFVMLIPLAVTSTNAMVRRLGARRWQALHRLVYLIAPMGVLHFWWMVKRDLTEPIIYALLLGVLLGYRLYVKARGPQPRARAAASG